MAQYKALGLLSAAYMQAFGNAVISHEKTVPSAALALNDTVDLMRIAGGTKLTELTKFNGDMDTGTTLQYKLGYRRANSDGVIVEDDDYFGSALTDLQAAVTNAARTRYVFDPITFDEDVFITATITAAATGVSGTPAIHLFAQGIARGIK